MSTAPAPQYVERARADLAAREYWRQLPPAERARDVLTLARRLALFDSPVGRAAAKVSGATDALAGALREFLGAFPTGEAAAEGARASAAWSGSPDEFDAGDRFAEAPEAFRAVLFSLEQLLVPTLEYCDVNAGTGG